MNYRALTQEEINQLGKQFCQAENWQNVQVADDFKPSTLWHVYFSGEVKLCSFQKTFELSDGCKKHAGIYHSHIHNCTIGKDVYISHVRNRVSNYIIANDAYIESVDSILTEGLSSFGNATKVAVLDETGSREIYIYDGVSAQIAYLQAVYKSDSSLSEALCSLVLAECEAKKSAQGVIGEYAVLLNCGTIKNVNIGAYSKLEGVSLLENGTVASSLKAPSKLGFGVIARDFIMSSGSVLSDAAQVERCYIGQACVLSKQFSAIDSVFFANSQGFHGEAVSVFAGPYSVTHHKSTLLIAGMFSFFNAGSASNQSNHMYKLGPIHYGVVDRGSKMASDSYIPWPSRVGSFSVIMGKHKNKFDSSSFPFSYLIADGAKTNLVPAVNLQSIGTFRDADKWKSRDLRTDETLLDLVEFRLFNPYVISQVLAGISKLKSISEQIKDPYFPADNEFGNFVIKDTAVQRGLELYQMALDVYLGDAVLSRLDEAKSLELCVQDSSSWVDIAGAVLPSKHVEAALNKIGQGELSTIKELSQELNNLSNLENDEWFFVSSILFAEYGSCNTEKVLSRWVVAKNKLIRLLQLDAQKEFSSSMQVCYGLDKDEQTRRQEFDNLRESAHTHAFVVKLIKDTEARIASAQKYF